mgnify:CR=1 FL=1
MIDSATKFAAGASYFGHLFGEAETIQDGTLYFTKSFHDGFVASLSADQAFVSDALNSDLFYKAIGYCNTHNIPIEEMTP